MGRQKKNLPRGGNCVNPSLVINVIIVQLLIRHYPIGYQGLKWGGTQGDSVPLPLTVVKKRPL